MKTFPSCLSYSSYSFPLISSYLQKHWNTHSGIMYKNLSHFSESEVISWKFTYCSNSPTVKTHLKPTSFINCASDRQHKILFGGDIPEYNYGFHNYWVHPLHSRTPNVQTWWNKCHESIMNIFSILSYITCYDALQGTLIPRTLQWHSKYSRTQPRICSSCWNC